MAEYKVPLNDIHFSMKKVFKLDGLWSHLNIPDLDFDTADAILEEAAKLCEQELAPLNREADEQGCRWSADGVTAPEGFKEAYSTYCEGGWGGLGGNPDYDGMGMPKTLVSPIEEMVQGSNISFGLAPMLTAGAALAINAHGSDDLKQAYLPNMYSGQWAGAMDLTEPHCGTDLGLLRTKAVPNDDGSYLLSGTKIFITWGEHDMAENIIHLVLAKLPDAPAGSRGISLFLVPKFLPNADGSLGERNPVHCGSLEKKMGIKASATCVMNFDNAKGWLVGEPNKGLACMFTMMNYERLAVGIQGVGVAEASYQSAVEYARERIQGRAATGPQSPDKEADNLLVHADVRRMLLTMRALNEGSRAFYFYTAKWLDISKFGSGDEQSHAQNMVSLLTPVSKSFMTDTAFQAAVHGQQVLGGHGYIREWGQEQHVRDIRITQIYEGTNGIQAMDLVGRKTIANGGALLGLYKQDVQNFIDEAKGNEAVTSMLVALQNSVETLQQATDDVLSSAKDDPNTGGSAAVDYLDLFGYVAYAHMWAMMAHAASQETSGSEFEQAKITTAQFYFAKLLPQVESLAARIKAGPETVMALDESLF
ncbi:MAG: acyl-CoA dehydrogenase C-terminal domain-containing protein [Agarilytica sp.]